MATELTWLGHGTWSITSGDHKIVLDPFINDNPSAPCKADDVEADFILVSHGHFDHVSDLVYLAKKTGAKVIAIFEIVDWLKNQGVDNAHPLNIGGGVSMPFGRVQMTNAIHSSVLPDGTYAGNPGGFLIQFPEGEVYFACDTALFSDMKLIPKEGLELAVLPIGDNFTMGPDDAARAVQLLEPKRVAPAHYNTWPPIEQDAEAWAKYVKDTTSTEPIVLQPGGTITL
ncbi:Metal-dependent hydrolase [Planctomycetales bacterium 10988]|nr:Metal-dependent hydrolase [Planctomycetales bacterium 10988]